MKRRMNRYRMIKKIKSLLCKLSLHLQENIFTEAEVKTMLTELDNLVHIVIENKKQGMEPTAIEEEAIFFLEAYKHYMGLEISSNGEILAISDLKHYLAYQTGTRKKSYMDSISINTDAMPRMLFI